MQGKGLIKFFLFLLLAVAAYQFMLIFPANKVENNAEAYGEAAAKNVSDNSKDFVRKQARVAYLDSVSSEKVFSIPLLKDYTYQELKAQQLALGLDLKGGMSVVLQVNLRDFIKTLANDSKDPTFNAALNKASEYMTNAQSDYVTQFARAWSEVSNGAKLSNIFMLNEGLRDKINSQTSDSEVIDILRTKSDETVDLTFKMLKERIDKFGVTQPNVSLDAARDLILVELPGIDNPERARTFIQKSAALEFFKVYRMNEANIFASLQQADSKLKEMMGDTAVVEAEPIINEIKNYLPEAKDSLGNIVDSTKFTVSYDTIPGSLSPEQQRGPLFKDLSIVGQGAVVGLADKNKKKTISELLAKPEVAELFPDDLKFLWSDQPTKDEAGDKTRDYYLYAIKTEANGKAPLQGDHITDASVSPDPNTGEIQVSLRMDGTGSQIWGDMTTEAARDNNRQVAIVLDNEVVSAPGVNEPILTGNTAITGNFTTQEGQDLATILQIGKLPIETNIIQEAIVGPTLGAQNISNSLWALAIGFILVLLFMVFYYGGGGVVSIITLLANLIFIFGALASWGTVLTLPGIAGIVLTIGMAVDANVIIFERIREELREGKALQAAIRDGFKHSYSAIIDANVTTILVAFVLLYFGLGPIKGFATVLWIGVLSSVFSAVLIGRLIIDWWVGDKGRNLSFWTGGSKNMFSNVNIDWMSKRKTAYMISGVIILLGLGSMFMRGFDLGVDFRGGYSYTVQFDEGVNVSAKDIRAALSTPFGGEEPVVKTFDATNTYSITTAYKIDEQGKEVVNEVIAALHSGINQLVGGNLSIDQFKNPDSKGTHISSASKVGPTIADDITTSSYYSTFFALLLIFLYIFIRFRRWQFSAGAVAALFHDVLIVLSLFSLLWGIVPWSLEIDQAFIAALLTVVGYSINDTVVVFDRIREFLDTYTGRSKTEIFNMAINSTVSRTIITSLTTLFVVLMLFLFGSGSIKSFAFALVIGILVGTYSSVFIASPIAHDLTGDIKTDIKKEKKRFSKALK